MNKLVIIGTGGMGRETAWLVERINREEMAWDLLGFVDDDNNKHGNIMDGYKVLGGIEWISEHNDNLYVVCAIANPSIKENIYKKLNTVRYATLIDPRVIMSERISIGEGTIICAGTVITVDIKIGSQVIINPNCTIGHDSELKDYVTLYPNVNIAGNTIINKSVEVGMGSKIIQGLSIGERAIIGAGATVINDLPKNCTAVGAPAKVIKYHD